MAVRHYCEHCGNEPRPDDRFCSNCGSHIHQPARIPAPEADKPDSPPERATVEEGKEQQGPTLGYKAELVVALVVGLLFAGLALAFGLGGTASMVVFLAAVALTRYGQKQASKKRPLAGVPTVNTRHIPQWVKVRVAARDGARCVRCGSTENIQFDHLIPFSRGGSSTDPNNIQLLCGRCNRLKGNRYIG